MMIVVFIFFWTTHSAIDHIVHSRIEFKTNKTAKGRGKDQGILNTTLIASRVPNPILLGGPSTQLLVHHGMETYLSWTDDTRLETLLFLVRGR